MTETTIEIAPDGEKRKAALRRILEAAERMAQKATTRSAQLLYYGIGLAAVWQIAQGDATGVGALASLGPEISVLAGMLEGEVLGGILDRVVHGDEPALDPEALQPALEAALAGYGTGGVLTEGEFYHAFHLLKDQLQEDDLALKAQLDRIEAGLAGLAAPGTPPIGAGAPRPRIPSAVDVEITIQAGTAGGYPVRIRLDGRQDFSGTLALDDQPAEDAGPEAVGAWLFRALSADDDLARGWDRVRACPQRRIRLCIDPVATELHPLPWEWLYDPAAGVSAAGTFLAADPDSPFSRTPLGSAPWGKPVQAPPLRILAAIAAPAGLPDTLTPIDREAELEALQAMVEALPTGAAWLDVLEGPVTLGSIAAKLLEGYHVLHLVAHGQRNRLGGEDVVYLEDIRGCANPVETGELVRHLTNSREPPALVVLGACRSAHTVAPALLAAGIPAVIAMNSDVRAATLQALGDTFYRRLLAHGEVDRALNEARGVLLARGDPGAAVPVLFMRLHEGWLLEPYEPPPGRIVPLQRGGQRPEYFTGRETELNDALKALAPGRAVTLCGPGGIGKTAIAIEAAWKLAPGGAAPGAFPDGIAFHSFYNQPGVERAAAALITSFSPESDDLSLEALERLLAPRRALLILDGAEDAGKEHGGLPSLLARTGGCAVLLTTRDRRDAPGPRIDVPQLNLDEALGLLRDWGGPRLAAPALDPVLGRACELLGRLPLALRLAGRYFSETGEPLDRYLPWLEEHPIDALNPYDAEHRQDNVDRLLERSLAQVGPGACRLLSAIGVHALTSFDPDFVGVALGLDRRTRRTALNELVVYGLLIRGEDGRAAVSHALIHAYAREWAALDDQACYDLLAAYTRLFRRESNRGPEGYRLLDRERPHLVHMLQTADKAKHVDAIRALTRAAYNYFDLQGHRLDHVAILETSLAAAQNQEDRCGEAEALGNLGVVHLKLGQAATAIEYFEQSLIVAREISDWRVVGTLLGALGGAFAALGQVATAIAYYEQAVPLLREVGDRSGESAQLENLGHAYAALGQATAAVEFHERALATYREIGDRHGEGSVLGGLGSVHLRLGHIVIATQYYQKELDICRKVGDRLEESTVLGNLGLAYTDLGQVATAIAYYEQALTVAREINDHRGEGRHLSNMGLAYALLGQVSVAIGYYEQALIIFRETCDPYGEGTSLGNLGCAYADLGQITTSIEYYRQALIIACEISDRRNKGAVLGHLGNAYLCLGQVAQAIEHYEQALAIYREIGDRSKQVVWLNHIGKAYADLGQVPMASDYYEQALLISREMGDRRGEGADLGNLGLA